MDLLQERFEEYNQTRDPAERFTFCQAPSVSLNFEQTGNVTACCYNRRFLLGKYPRNSIQEIWSGDAIRRMREAMKDFDLSQGCQLCRHQLEARNFGGLRARGFDGLADLSGGEAAVPLMPKLMELEISNVCNYECVMCNGYFSSSIRKNREKLEPMQSFYDEDFVDQLVPFLPHLREMKFLGGEPFLNPLYYKIWEKIIEVNPAVNAIITTNGSVLNDKSRAMLQRLKPAITVSLDSLDKTTYESIRRNGRFETVMENLRYFIELNRGTGKGMSLSICPMRQNWKTIPDLMRFCNRERICLGINTVVWPPDCSLQGLPKSQLRKIAAFLLTAADPALGVSEHWWIRHNLTAYLGMINQIRLWGSSGDAS